MHPHSTPLTCTSPPRLPAPANFLFKRRQIEAVLGPLYPVTVIDVETQQTMPTTVPLCEWIAYIRCKDLPLLLFVSVGGETDRDRKEATER